MSMNLKQRELLEVENFLLITSPCENCKLMPASLNCNSTGALFSPSEISGN